MEDLVELASSQLPAIGLGAAAAIATTAGVAYLMKNRSKPVQTVVPLDEQSLSVNGDPYCRVSKLVPEGTFLEYVYDDVKTLYQVFLRGRRVSEDGPCLGHRVNGMGDFVWISYSETIQRAEYLGSGLIFKGLQPGQQTCVGIFAKNRPEWIITELACYTYSMVIVPIYDTLGTEACAHIISQAEISSVICDRDEQALILLKLAAKTPVLRRIVIMNKASDAVLAQAQQINVEVIQFSEVLILGKANLVSPQPPTPKSLATVCYTSGTTGTPKGVMLSHGNVVAAVCATMTQIGLDFGPQREDCMLSFLPLSHMLERCCETALYAEGGRMGFFSGDIRKLNDDLKVLKPTCVVVVPRLLNRICDTVTGKVKGSWLKQTILNVGIWFKEWDLHSRVISRSTFWDRLIFKKVQDEMGGNVRFVIVGSAPLSPAVLRFSRVALGCSIMEGYGQTEAVAPCTLTVNGDINPDDSEGNVGHVGPPIPCCMIKLCDVPEMDIVVNRDGTGEICVKGSNVFQGYFKEPEKTREVLDDDGWLHTGDIGLWADNGCLKIIDRKKHIFKLSQGEYIAPEKIESFYVKNTCVAQVFVHGDSLKSCLIAVVIPEQDVLKRWAASEGIDGTFSELCKNPKVKQMLLKELAAEGKAAGLHSFEQVKDIIVQPDLFSVENNMLTPTLKTKRNEIRKKFAKQLADVYARLD